MPEVFDEYGDERKQAPAENIMQELEQTVHLLIKQNQEVSEAEEVLKAATARRNKTRFAALPEVMKRAGNLMEYKLELPNGMIATVKRTKDPGGALSKGNREYVLKWVEENGMGHLISNDVVLPFTAGQHEELLAAEEKLKAAGLQYSIDRTIQSSRYSALCARLVDSNKVTPKDYSLFGIHVVEEAKVKIKERPVRRGRSSE